MTRFDLCKILNEHSAQGNFEILYTIGENHEGDGFGMYPDFYSYEENRGSAIDTANLVFEILEKYPILGKWCEFTIETIEILCPDDAEIDLTFTEHKITEAEIWKGGNCA